jgi:hypothetical protein
MNLNDKYQPMLDVLASQAEQYAEMTALARRQVELLTESNPAALTEVLNQKQQLMTKIESGNSEIGPLKASWADDRETVDADLRARVEQAVDKVRDVLRELVELENAFREQVTGKRNQTRDEIQQVRRTNAARKAYGQPNQPQGNDPRFMDRTE